jgi:hypothetical protein
MIGTVQKPLSTGEVLEFGSAVLQQLGRSLDPDKVRFYIQNKGQLKNDLLQLNVYKEPKVELESWELFYRKNFGTTIDLSKMEVTERPAYPCFELVVVPVISNYRIFDACDFAFTQSWLVRKNLNGVEDVGVRPSDPYFRWVCTAEYSPRDGEALRIHSLTLRERMLLDLKCFDDGRKLPWSQCLGSRFQGGTEPNVYWEGFRYHVDDRPQAVRYRGEDKSCYT